MLVRGFKIKAERIAVELRKELSIHPCNPLCAFKLAEHLKIPVYQATECVTSKEGVDLLSGASGDNCGWSALTMTTGVGNRIIIYNPYHSPARQQSDIMHELAHVIREHKIDLSKYNMSIPLGMMHYNEDQEDEAKWLGGVLQVPRPALLWAVKKGLSKEEMATYFNASLEMITYRLNTSGVTNQVRRFKRVIATKY